jgi:ATP phosphoribosyltransferase regulatory subunit
MTDDPPSPALLPAGLADLLPPEAEREAALVEAMAEIFARHGYDRVKPPLLEFEDSLFAGSGAALADQTFRLMDPISQRMMGLRADTTPQVARIAATRLARVARPLRLSYAGQVLRVARHPARAVPPVAAGRHRADRPRPARRRCRGRGGRGGGAAAIGIADPTLDITLPRLSPALLDAAGVEGEARRRLARALDRKDAAAVAERAAGCGAAMQDLVALLNAAGPADGALAVLQEAALPPAARAIADNAAAIVAAVRGLAPELRITLDPVEFRGLRYHTGVAFTLFGPGRAGELARGGRYLCGRSPRRA